MLKELFVSEVRVNILKLLVLNPDKSYHVRGIVREVKAEINAVRRELENLFKINMVRRRQSLNKIYYTIDTTHPFYPDLLSLLSKETGLGIKIISNIRELGDVKFAMLTKPFIKGRISTALDVDLFIVGNVKVDVLERLVKDYERFIGREIYYSTMPEEEFVFRKRKNDHFIMKLLTQGRAMLVGDEDKFSTLM